MLYEKMPDDVRLKLRELLLKNARGQAFMNDSLWCSQQFKKYGPEQYGSVVAQDELIEAAKQNPLYKG